MAEPPKARLFGTMEAENADATTIVTFPDSKLGSAGARQAADADVDAEKEPSLLHPKGGSHALSSSQRSTPSEEDSKTREDISIPVSGCSRTASIAFERHLETIIQAGLMQQSDEPWYNEHYLRMRLPSLLEMTSRTLALYATQPLDEIETGSLTRALSFMRWLIEQYSIVARIDLVRT